MKKLFILILLCLQANLFGQKLDTLKVNHIKSWSSDKLIDVWDSLNLKKPLKYIPGAGAGKALISDANGVGSWQTAAGPTGATGVTGITGATGNNGSDGATGATGITGITGSTGATGATGVTGNNGSDGVTGVTGSTGNNGSNGVTGATGATGMTGIGIIHGFIVAGIDASTGASWATGCTGETGLVGASGTSVGSGQANTDAILAGCTTVGIAAEICNSLVLDGYTNWYLPSKEELNEIYLQKDIIGGFTTSSYWSSSEDDANNAWLQGFGNGAQSYSDKTLSIGSVRCIRSATAAIIDTTKIATQFDLQSWRILTVEKNGGEGKYTTINDAITAINTLRGADTVTSYLIRVMKGTFTEDVNLPRAVSLVGIYNMSRIDGRLTVHAGSYVEDMYISNTSDSITIYSNILEAGITQFFRVVIYNNYDHNGSNYCIYNNSNANSELRNNGGWYYCRNANAGANAKSVIVKNISGSVGLKQIELKNSSPNNGNSILFWNSNPYALDVGNEIVGCSWVVYNTITPVIARNDNTGYIFLGVQYVNATHPLNTFTKIGSNIYFSPGATDPTLNIPCGTPITDFDGNTYNTIEMGTQCWMRSNLTTTHYKNGTPITLVEDQAAWAALTTEARCYRDNDSATNKSIFGALYNWYAVNNANGLCPTGWHVPSHNEWTTLERSVVTTNFPTFPYDTTTTSWVGSDQADKLKESGTTHWYTGNSGTNTSGFTALGGGFRHSNGSFPDGTYYYSGYWWTATTSGAITAWFREMAYNNSTVYRYNADGKVRGYSVRCVKD